MRRSLRLLTRAQMEALEDTHLHDFLRRKCRRDVRELAEEISNGFTEEEPHAEEVCKRLAERLRTVHRLRRRVLEEIEVGGTTLLTIDDFFEALAAWAIENQIIDGIIWQPDHGLRRDRTPAFAEPGEAERRTGLKRLRFWD